MSDITDVMNDLVWGSMEDLADEIEDKEMVHKQCVAMSVYHIACTFGTYVATIDAQRNGMDKERVQEVFDKVANEVVPVICEWINKSCRKLDVDDVFDDDGPDIKFSDN